VRRRPESAAACVGAARATSLAVYRIRRATAADAGVLARHRAEMFCDMGELPDGLYDALVEAARAYVTQAITDGRYVGWVAELDAESGEIVGGAGLQLRELLPRPNPGRERLVRGPRGVRGDVDGERGWGGGHGADAPERRPACALHPGAAGGGAANQPSRGSIPALRRWRSDKCARARGSGRAHSPRGSARRARGCPGAACRFLGPRDPRPRRPAKRGT